MHIGEREIRVQEGQAARLKALGKALLVFARWVIDDIVFASHEAEFVDLTRKLHARESEKEK